ncbi:MAG: NAD(P)/FAD-dependent oxidoreductase [Tranquillimonas sp.]
MKDCIVIGGGPAGLTASIYLSRFLRKVVLFDAGAPRARLIPCTRNLAGYPGGISGVDLLDRMRRQLAHYDLTPVPETVTGIGGRDGAFRVTTGSRTVEARTIILATGVTNHAPDMPAQSHDDAVAQGLIRYCPICDAYEVRGQKVAVLGRGDHAVAEAGFLRRYSEDVTLVLPAGDAATADEVDAARAAGLALLRAPAKAIRPGENRIALDLADGTEAVFDTLYSALGTTPHAGLAEAMGVRLSEAGGVLVDAHNQTSVPGVYAIGDLIEGLDQIAFAMGQASVAATAIHNGLRG